MAVGLGGRSVPWLVRWLGGGSAPWLVRWLGGGSAPWLVISWERNQGLRSTTSSSLELVWNWMLNNEHWDKACGTLPPPR